MRSPVMAQAGRLSTRWRDGCTRSSSTRSILIRGRFGVVFVLGDASPANADVFKAYLEDEQDAPEKVLVSPSHGAQPFPCQGWDGTTEWLQPAVLHVLADGFPAGSLRVDYRGHLSVVRREPSLEGQGISARKNIMEQEADRIKRRAVESIFLALATVPDGQQVIFFAQDRLLLRGVMSDLLNSDGLNDEHLGAIETHGVTLEPDAVALLDAGVPSKERMALMQPATRDTKRVFLMTSSGSRGVDFPLATTIIAMVPTFAIESGFMEIAQLVYRGRGETIHPTTRARINGRCLRPSPDPDHAGLPVGR